MLKELKLFIRNEFHCCSLFKTFYIVKIRSCECPHRLSDYIVKEQCVAVLSASRGGVCYAYHLQSQRLF
ncbi:hypothetical protein C5E22_21435 [Pectobacterium parmentieri]|nr:hypothetical protein C5E24_01185 [Pectobacterium parmentieri]AYH20812.1 hypothetical protein C5E22_21435 [Pectobacterium parmentieri]AYH34801.1 hypothetical protein C5E17_01255 [Pectobacterium parmentieri]AZS54877.1 hypothetical protein C5E18_01185 [Pectobacterium parmentieri]